MPNFQALLKSPFYLPADGIAWVKETLAALSLEQKLAQLLVVQSIDACAENLNRLARLGIGGFYCRASSPLASLRDIIPYIQSRCAIPLLVCGDLELGAEGGIGGASGTAFPNQMTVAATGDLAFAERMARIAAREGRAAGFNWTFSPVADLVLNLRNALVNTRAFTDDAVYASRLVATYVRALQAEGVAACAKHWPGDGWDDRNQHFVTTRNGSSFAEWDGTYGRVYRAAIRAGVLSIMSAHIALPGFRGAGETPASLSPALNLRLLRDRLKFRGLIVSDASTMGGITSLAARRDFVPRIIASGCDMLLFTPDPELDLGHLREAVGDRRLSMQRVDAAVTHVLALKAALRLHRGFRPARPGSVAMYQSHRRWARECAERAVTLVKDEARLLPLSPRRHHRLLLIQEPALRKPAGGGEVLDLGPRLTAAGFRVEHLTPEVEVHRDFHDVVVYAVAEEASKTRASMELRWLDLQGGFPRAMDRYWHDVPTIFISFGTPFHLRDVPACPTFINAYSPTAVMQAAVVDALVGAIPFRGRSPVTLTAS